MADYIIPQRTTFDIEIEFTDTATPPVVIPVPAEFTSGKAALKMVGAGKSTLPTDLALSLTRRAEGIVVVTITDDQCGELIADKDYQVDCLLETATGTRSRPMKVICKIDGTVTL
jgi:hypothetical protein